MLARDLSKVMRLKVSDATTYTGFTQYNAAYVRYQHQLKQAVSVYKHARSVLNWKHIYECHQAFPADLTHWARAITLLGKATVVI